MKILTSSVMVVILATLLFAGRLFDVSPVETLRLKTFDYYQKISPRDVTTNSVVIVEITEQDLKKYGQWPWPRNLIANLHNRIYQYGAKVIQYNIIFAERDRAGKDENFAQKLAGTNTVMMYSIKDSATDGQVAKVPVVKQGDSDKFLYSFKGVVTNIPELLRFANGAGVNIMIPNIDGTIRQIPLFVNTDIGTIPNQILEHLNINHIYLFLHRKILVKILMNVTLDLLVLLIININGLPLPPGHLALTKQIGNIFLSFVV